MKLPSKYIALVVILSLAAIFAYQAYWLTNLYRTQRQTMERNITEALRMSDYNEMILRIRTLEQDSTEHGEVSVSAGYNNTTPYVETRTVTTEKSPDSTQMQQTVTMVKDTAAMQSALHTDAPDFLFGKKNTMSELAGYFQRGLHAGLDAIQDPDFATYDSLLTDELQRLGIHEPHRLLYLHRSNAADSSDVGTDTLGLSCTEGYVPSALAQSYEYCFDLHDHWLYRLTLEPLHGIVLRQMAGILATSLLIFVVLGFSFWYLVRILLRQRTLEEMKDDFTNTVTHELKTPIAVAYAANDALLNFGANADEEKRTRYLRICQEQLQHLGGLVEQILGMSMERRKTFRLHRTVFPVEEVIAPLLEQHKLKADKPVGITLHIEPCGLKVNADRTHFANIVSNLLDNAIKYSPGQAQIEIHCRETEEGRFELTVGDKGIGIGKEKQAHVFDKFYRVPTGNLHNVKGYGLGLFYVKTMVEKHGGTVDVQSEPGHGSTFKITLEK